MSRSATRQRGSGFAAFEELQAVPAILPAGGGAVAGRKPMPVREGPGAL